MTSQPQRIGPYEVLKLLGKGGMAQVFKVRAVSGPHAGNEYALKQLLPSLEADEESVRLFTAEAELSRHLRHPNIVEVFEAGFVGDSLYMVMEFIDGRDLAQIVRRCKKRGVAWPVDFAVYLTKVLLDALGYAHTAKAPSGAPLGVVHCDVSPSNFFVSRTGDLRLGDFGLARSLLEGGPEQLIGKPYYLSPEALDGQLSPQVDLWAVGVTLYELLTLQRPFQGSTPDEVFQQIRSARYTPLRTLRPDVPEVLEAVITRALDARPERRFGSAPQFAEALKPLHDERIGTPLAISAIVRGLFGSSDE